MRAAVGLGFVLSHLAPGLVAVGIVLFASPLLPAQQRHGVVPPEGSQALRHLLHQFPFQCEPLQKAEDLRDVDPGEALVIVIGNPAGLDDVIQVTGGLGKFRERGGAILVATDHDDRGRLRDLKVHVTGTILRQVAGKAYRGLEDCPLVTSGLGSRHPLFGGLQTGIATNRPSYIVPHDPDLILLASLTGVVDSGRQDPGLRIREEPFLLASGADDKDRVVILADSEVFSNILIAQNDNDNLLFALNCVRWLTDAGKRRKVLFVEDGKVQTSFDVPLAQRPALPLPPVRIIDQVLRGLEDENAFNRLLLEGHDKANLVRVILVVLTVLLVILGLRRLLQGRHHLEPRLPLVARKVALALAVPPLVTQRRDALVRSGNLWETARDLARECFEAHDVPGRGDRWPPPFKVATGWWQGRQLARLIGQLWDLAYGPAPSPVSPRRLAQVHADAEQLSAALEAGAVVFNRTGPS
jgi:hypothetical protein